MSWRKKKIPSPVPQPRHGSLPNNWGHLVCVCSRVFVSLTIWHQYLYTHGDQLCTVLPLLNFCLITLQPSRWYVHAQSLNRVWLFVTPWSVACQAALSMEYSRQEYWSGFPFPSLGIFLTQGLYPHVLPWQASSSLLSHRGRPSKWYRDQMFTDKNCNLTAFI